MKKLFLFSLTIFILCSYGELFGQYIPLSIDYKIDKSELIVEGKVLSTKSFIGNDNEVYTENIIEVAKIHKGDLREERIAVITMGGIIDGRTVSWSHLLSLSLSQYGVFFINPSERATPAPSTFAAFDVFGGVQGFYHFQKKDNGVYQVHSTLDKYNSVSEFYQVIEAKDFEDSPFVSPFDLVNEDDCLSFKIEPIFNTSSSPTSSSISTNTQIWFNVMVKVNDGYYKLNKSELLLKYSTEWFYENMADEGHITFVQGEFDETAYAFEIEDHEEDVVKLKTEAITNDYEALEAVEGEWKLLVSIGVVIKSISDENPLKQLLDNNSIIENNYKTIAGYIEDFDCVMLSYGANCGMSITSITPVAAAGVGLMSESGITGVIEIQGNNFLDDEADSEGCIKPIDHHVKFRTVGGDWIAPFEGDYLEYTNTKIRVKVPSLGYRDNSSDIISDLNTQIACTGTVRVCREGLLGINCGCFTTSSDELYIPFVARNTKKTNSNGCTESVRYVLQNLDNVGGYTWRFDPSFASTTGAKDAFARALTTWRCHTGVNFKVDEINPPGTDQGLCTVKMTNLGEGVRGATSFTSFNNCFETDIWYPSQIEIAFNSTMNWHTGTNMPDLNWSNIAETLEGDMESTALHELGHAHLLLHTCNSPNVMVSPGPNDFRRELTSDDENGGNHLSMIGSNTNGCSGSMDLIPSADCVTTHIVEIDGEKINVEIYPNPTQNEVFLNFNSFIFDGTFAAVELIDSFGKQLDLKGVNNNGQILRFNIDRYPSGIYYFRYIDEGNQNLIIGKVTKI